MTQHSIHSSPNGIPLTSCTDTRSVMRRQMHPSVCLHLQIRYSMNLKMLLRKYVSSSDNTCQRWIYLAKLPIFSFEPFEGTDGQCSCLRQNEPVGGLQCGVRRRRTIQVISHDSWLIVLEVLAVWQNDESCILYAQRIRAWLAFQETPNW